MTISTSLAQIQHLYYKVFQITKRIGWSFTISVSNCYFLVKLHIISPREKNTSQTKQHHLAYNLPKNKEKNQHSWASLYVIAVPNGQTDLCIHWSKMLLKGEVTLGRIKK